MPEWLRRPHVLLAAGVFVLTLGVYTATLGPTTDFWDCGEFITTSHIVGVPHQPGTPLYVLVGRVFDVILGNPDITKPAMRTAWAINFMSAFFSALAVMFIFLTIREIARRADPDSGWLPEIGGLTGALFLAFSRTFWNNAIEAEVYGLSGFMLALLTWLTVRWYDYREHEGSNNLLLLMIYLLGLGVGFHLGVMLVYPGIFVLVLLSKQRKLGDFDLWLMSVGLFVFLLSTAVRNNALVVVLLIAYVVIVAVRSMQGKHFALLGSALFFVGLTVHVMMLIRAGAHPEPVVNQTDPDNFATLLKVIRREQYPPLNPFTRQAPLGWQFKYYYDFLFQQFYFLGSGHGWLSSVTTFLGPVFLALLGLFHGLRRARPLIFVPLVSYLINGEVLTLYLNFTNHEVRDRDYFYFAAFMFFAVFIGLGASALLRYVTGGEGKTAAELEAAGENYRKTPRVRIPALAKVGAAIVLIMALLPAIPGQTKWFEHDRHENRIAYEYAWNILAGLDENSIVFTNGDNDTFPIWYLQYVEHFRPDVTVVNLSLVNLPWYIKQLKHDAGLAMRRNDQQIDALRHEMRRNPKTGQTELKMIKDFVLEDVIARNFNGEKRPVFFAVTIPQENMQTYFPYLQMEGMAYRLTTTKGPDNMPSVDPDKVLENMLGVYELGAVMTGDTPARQRRYAEMSGRATDTGPVRLGVPGHDLAPAQFDTLMDMLGQERTDVYRNDNATKLLGNYPVAFTRAGFEDYQIASKAASTDTTEYKIALHKSLTAFAASLAVDPFNPQAMEFYPLLLVQDYRDQDAKDFLASLDGKVPRDVEERTIYNTLRGIVRAGVPELAFEFLGERIAAHPERHFFYQAEFSLYQALGAYKEAQDVANAWQQQSGQEDPEMVKGLEQMRQGLLRQEQQRIEDAAKHGMPDSGAAGGGTTDGGK